MNAFNELWVLGHRIKPMLSSGDFDAVIGESSKEAQSWPPHYHTKFTEFFYVMDGELEFLIDGKPVRVKAGESIDIPAYTLHTFKNPNDELARWMNVYSPKGYMSFFYDLGISRDLELAEEVSVSGSSITKLLSRANHYDMFLSIEVA